MRPASAARPDRADRTDHVPVVSPVRIVVELRGRPQVSFGGRPYEGSTADPPTWLGAYVEGLIVDGSETICLEGDLISVRSALRDALEQLEQLESAWRDLRDEVARSSVQCSVCARWYDARVRMPHGDGLGRPCTPPP